MNRKIKTLLCFMMSFVLVFGSSLTVYASDNNLKGYSGWTLSQKADYHINSFLTLCGVAFSVYFGGSDATAIQDYMSQRGAELAEAEGLTYQEWLIKQASVDEEEGTVVYSDELVDVLKEGVDAYIKANSNPWHEVQTKNARDIDLSIFETKAQYNAFVDYVKSNNVLATQYELLSTHRYLSESGELLTENKDVKYFTFYAYSLDNSFTYSTDYVSQDFYRLNLHAYDDNWEHIGPIFCQIDESGNIEEMKYYYSAYLFLNPQYKPWQPTAYTHGVCLFRLYNTLNDLKQYTVGQRKWLAGNQYYNYDSSQDNSVTLTNSDLTNSSLYGDVYNYVIDNGGDSLTENELRDILDDYLNGFNNNGGGSSGSGNGSGSGSGSGLTGLLGGIGSLFDGIMAILGKLLEYIGKAIQLFSDTLINIVEVIPKGMSQLLVLIFPFIPNEWVVAIELGLVLSVIGIVIKLFKG